MRLPQVTDREWRLIEPAPAAGPSPWQTAPGRSALCQRFLRRRSGACAALLGAHPRRQPRLEKLDTVFRSRRDPTAAGPRASWPLCRPAARARGLIDGQDDRGLARNIEAEWQACETRLRAERRATVQRPGGDGAAPGPLTPLVSRRLGSAVTRRDAGFTQYNLHPSRVSKLGRDPITKILISRNLRVRGCK